MCSLQCIPWPGQKQKQLPLNQLLLGQNFTLKSCYTNKGELSTLTCAREYHRQFTNFWWVMWKEQSFPYLLLYYSQFDVKKNTILKISDICQFEHADKIPKHDRLCIVIKMLPAEDEVVRIMVTTPNYQCTKRIKNLTKKDMEEGVRRLSLILYKTMRRV